MKFERGRMGEWYDSRMEGMRGYTLGTALLLFGMFTLIADPTQRGILNADDRVLWKAQLGGAIEHSASIDELGTIYIAAENGVVAAYRKDGHELWRVETPTEIIRSSPVIIGEQVVVGGEDGVVRSFDRRTGALLYERSLSSSVRSTIAYDAARRMIYVATLEGDIVALDAQGDVMWKAQVGDKISSSPAVDDDGIVYIATHAGTVVALKNEEEIWRVEVGSTILSSPALTQSSIIIGAEDGRVIAFKKNGEHLWTWRAPYERTAGRGIESSPAVGKDGVVYVGSKNHRLYALQNGKLLWAVELGWEIESSPTIGDDGIIYIGAEDNNIYAISPIGRIVWAIHTEGQVDSPPAIAGGQLYAGSQDGFLYAAAVSSKEIAQTPWPKLHANSMNHGGVEE